MRDDQEHTDEVIGALVARLKAMPVSDPRARAAILARVRGRRQSPWRATLAEAWQPSVPLLAAATIAVAALGVGYASRVIVEPATPIASTESALESTGLVPVSNTKDGLITRQFVLDAPSATNVALVGDFNSWDPSATTLRRSASGVWQVSVALQPGRHVYAFLVNDSLVRLDPRADKVADEFGRENSVILVSDR